MALQLEADVALLKQQLTDHLRQYEEQKMAFTDIVSKEISRQQVTLEVTINDARSEFNRIKAAMDQLVIEMKQKFDEQDKKLGGSGSHGGGYLPLKNTIPDKFDEDLAEWINWTEDVEKFFDSKNKGIRDCLKSVAKSAQEIDMSFMESYPHNIRADAENIYRTLEHLTKGEARKIVKTVRNENGFEAWRQLHIRFQPGISAKHGFALVELTEMIKKPAKNPEEMRHMVTELLSKIKNVEDITGKPVDDDYAKSVLIGFMDKATRQHTAMQHAETFENLKKIVLQFVNNTMGGSTDHMNIGAVMEDSGQEHKQDRESSCWDDLERLAAMGKPITCHQCGGVGHIARNCSTPIGKGVDRGQSKGLGKGKADGKGPRTGCWHCGGNHYADQCSSVKGGNYGKASGKGGGKASKGKGKGLFYAGEDGRDRLCNIREADVKKPIDNVDQNDRIQEEKQLQQVHSGAKNSQPEVAQEDDEAEGCWTVVAQKEKKQKMRRVKHWKKMEAHTANINIFQTIEPEELNNIGNGEWELLEMAVDSGATETVINEGMIKAVGVQESAASRRGVEYEVANGVRIPNLGEKTFVGYTEDGKQRTITAQVCDVSRGLLSVDKMLARGNRVIFDDDGSYIENKYTREKIWLNKDKGMFMLNLWVKRCPF